MKKQVLLLMMALLPMVASAEVLFSNGVYFDFNPDEKTAYVTYMSYIPKNNIDAYWGDLIIPSEVTFNGKKYSVTSIGENAFQYCSGLISVIIPNCVTSISASAFYGCSGLTSIVVDKNNPIYDSRDNCNAIIETTTNTLIVGCHNTIIPNSVTSIGSDAFSGCSGLTSVTIPNSVTSIDGSAFSGCSGLTSVTIGNSVTSIGSRAFEYCSGLTSIEMPNSIIGIGGSAFEGCNGLSSITIPNSVTSIGDKAFSGCTSLTSVIIPNSVTSIGESAFEKTPWYQNQSQEGPIYLGNVLYEYKGTMPANTDFVIKEGTVAIGSNVFSGCNGLTSITIPNSVTTIGYNAFQNCNGLTSVIIPDGVTSIGDNAFSGCSRLVSVEIPNSVTTIGWFTFSNCTSLTSVIIPDGVKYIGFGTFQGCQNLTSVTIGNSVEGIGPAAFVNCISLTSVVIPESVAGIAEEVFQGCTNLTSVIIPNSMTYIGFMAFEGCTSLTSVIIPDGITSIDSETFSGCSGLTSITIPNGVTDIYGKAFSGCSGLTSITIPNSVINIENEAFSGCNSVTDVYCLAEDVPSTSINVFNNSNIKNATLHVSGTSIAKYRNNAVWGAFGTIVAPSYTLTFIVDGEVYNSFVLEEGTDITIDYQPQKKGYTFTLLGEMPETMPSHDVTVTGSFTRIIPKPSYKRYLISRTTGESSFKVGDVYLSRIVEFNLLNSGTESINVTELIVKNPNDNYSVVSQNTDASLLGQLDGGQSINMSVNLKSDITICYEWHYIYKGQEFVFCSDENDPAMKHDVTYYVDNQIYVTYEYDFGDEIITEAEPTKDGWSFSGWDRIPKTMPNYNIRVNGSFTLVDAIEGVNADDGEYQIYTLEGKQVENLQNGVNIIRYSDGSTKKVYVK